MFLPPMEDKHGFEDAVMGREGGVGGLGGLMAGIFGGLVAEKGGTAAMGGVGGLGGLKDCIMAGVKPELVSWPAMAR